MRHNKKGKKLSRDSQHRSALYRNLLKSMVEHGAIETTHTKAKAVQSQLDKLVTKAKVGSVHARRQIDSVLNKTSLTNRLVEEIAPKTGKRNSGFTRVIRLGRRRGDAAMMVRLEFVDQVVEGQAVEKDTQKKEPKKAAKPAKKEAKTKEEKDTKASTPAPQSANKKQQTKVKQMKSQVKATHTEAADRKPGE